eukprot:COSAG02_NODE_31962_length_524_cov_1.122353_1_plen_45_part_10
MAPLRRCVLPLAGFRTGRVKFKAGRACGVHMEGEQGEVPRLATAA